MPTRTLAFVQPAAGDHSAAQRGALAALRDSDCALVLFEGEAGSAWLLEDLRRFLDLHRPQGAILLPPLSAVPGLAALCAEHDCPPVRLSPCDLPGPLPVLCANDRQAMADATQYLIALGHCRIGFIAGPEHCLSSRECELGFIDALAAHELDRGAELVAASDGSLASGLEAALLLLDVSPRPTAILAASDELAAGALKAAISLGVEVPGALSIIGFGGSALAQALPASLTSLRPPWSEMTFAAATELAGTVGAPQPAEFFAALVPGETTGPPAQAKASVSSLFQSG